MRWLIYSVVFLIVFFIVISADIHFRAEDKFQEAELYFSQNNNYLGLKTSMDVVSLHPSLFKSTFTKAFNRILKILDGKEYTAEDKKKIIEKLFKVTPDSFLYRQERSRLRNLLEKETQYIEKENI